MRVRASLGMVLGLLAAPAAWGQDVKPAAPPANGVHRMEIFDGPTRTVHLFSSSTSASERQIYGDLERAENEATYAASLQALRRQYVTGERRLEARRQLEQQQLYGWNFNRSYSAAYSVGSPYGYGYGYPYYGYGSYGYGGGTSLSASTSVSQTLGTGIAPDGIIKQEMARVLASQSTAEYSAAADRQLERALAALPTDGKPGGIRAVAFGPNAPPRNGTVLLKGGEKIEGRIVYEDADWIVVQTAAGDERVRMGDVTRVTTKTEK